MINFSVKRLLDSFRRWYHKVNILGERTLKKIKAEKEDLGKLTFKVYVVQITKAFNILDILSREHPCPVVMDVDLL